MSTLACSNDFASLIESDNFFAMAVIAMGCVTAVVGIVGGTTASVMRARAKEQTKREIAAYVAEGTLEPEKAVAILNAGMPKWEVPDIDKIMGRKG